MDTGHFRLHDDIGTEYGLVSGSSGGGRRSDRRLEAAYPRSPVARLDVALRG
jgi:hypothetical protein